MDFSEKQKLTMYQNQIKYEQQNTKVKDSLRSLIDHIIQQKDIYQEIQPNQQQLASYERLLADINRLEIDPEHVLDLPPCSIQ